MRHYVSEVTILSETSLLFSPCLSVLLNLCQCYKNQAAFKREVFSYTICLSILHYCKVWSLQVTNKMSLWEHIICSLGVFSGEKLHVEQQACISPSLGSISSTQARLGDIVVGCACFWKLELAVQNHPLHPLSHSLHYTLCFSVFLSHALFKKKITKLPLQHVSQPFSSETKQQLVFSWNSLLNQTDWL